MSKFCVNYTYKQSNFVKGICNCPAKVPTICEYLGGEQKTVKNRWVAPDFDIMIIDILSP